MLLDSRKRLHLLTSLTQSTEQMPTSSERPTKPSVSFGLRSDLADKIMYEAAKHNTSPDDFISSILARHFLEESSEKTGLRDTDAREHDRKCVSIPAFIEVKMPTNETQYKHVNIVDISAGGIGFKMNSDSPRIVEKIRDTTPFFVIFYLSSASEIVEVLCNPVHVTSNGFTHVGASFIKAPDKLKNTIESRIDP